MEVGEVESDRIPSCTNIFERVEDGSGRHNNLKYRMQKCVIIVSERNAVNLSNCTVLFKSKRVPDFIMVICIDLSAFISSKMYHST